jgi:hypothetical protein
MKPYLQAMIMHCDRQTAIWMCIQEQIKIREKEAAFDPNDFDLNPHLQLVSVANQVLKDCELEGFHKDELKLEDVYLLWLTMKIFHKDLP